MDPHFENYKKTKSPIGNLLSYKIGDNTIIHCYDPPHLLKGIRNNLITKNLSHRIEKRWNVGFSKSKRRQSARVASWDHVEKTYSYSLQASRKLLPKISAEHINPKKRKMRVAVAAQIFSETYAKRMLEFVNNKILPQKFAHTAEILLFFNDVFDSFNASSQSGNNYLKSAVTKTSVHFEFWNYALCMLSKMQFYDKKTGTVTNRTSVLRHFESTIKGYMEICRKCFKQNITEISIRYFRILVKNVCGSFTGN